jgi:copper-binding protein NosD
MLGLAVPLVAAATIVAQAATASAGTTVSHGGNQRTLFVSPNASPSAAGQSCASAAYATIGAAVSAAPAGGTVVVCQGTYHEQVVVSKPLSLLGQGATINETGVTPGLQLDIANEGSGTIYAGVAILSSDVTFSGFTVTEAIGQGIVAVGGLGHGELSHITISHSAVVHNDQGFGVANTPYFWCQPPGQNDCGEGIFFSAVDDSTISDSDISDNSGGVLLTDDTGPTHNNLVTGNLVNGNSTDCGITVPGHNSDALSAAGRPQPNVAGVYANVISHNVVTDNGVAGEGAGVLFANATNGTASYDNLVIDNVLEGNGLSGVTFHAHVIASGQFEDLSGNELIGNTIGKNNVDGDTLDFPAFPAEDLATTGILVYTAGTPVTVMIAGNHVSDDSIGIWLSKAVTASGLPTNTFSQVSTRISAGN